MKELAAKLALIGLRDAVKILGPENMHASKVFRGTGRRSMDT